MPVTRVKQTLRNTINIANILLYSNQIYFEVHWQTLASYRLCILRGSPWPPKLHKGSQQSVKIKQKIEHSLLLCRVILLIQQTEPGFLTLSTLSCGSTSRSASEFSRRSNVVFMIAGVWLCVVISVLCVFAHWAAGAISGSCALRQGWGLYCSTGWGSGVGSGLGFAETFEGAALVMAGLFKVLPLEASHPVSFALRKGQKYLNINDYIYWICIMILLWKNNTFFPLLFPW